MPTATTSGLFCPAALALIVVPGPAVTYVVTQSVDTGPKTAAVFVALGATAAAAHR